MATFPLLTIHGARGSSPVSGPAIQRIGGHTTSLELTAPGADAVLIDAGSGLLKLEPAGRTAFTVLFTHFHWDHLQGLPFFAPLYDHAARIDFVARAPDGGSVEEALVEAIRPPWFPVPLAATASAKTYHDLPDGRLTLGPFAIDHIALPHPGGVTAYRFTTNGTSVVFATDVEMGEPAVDARLRAFAAGADVLIHDAQYTPEEYEAKHRGWGHSTWEHAAANAAAAGVGRLILTSHDPQRRDDAVDAIVGRAQALFPRTEAAYSGLSIAF